MDDKTLNTSASCSQSNAMEQPVQIGLSVPGFAHGKMYKRGHV